MCHSISFMKTNNFFVQFFVFWGKNIFDSIEIFSQSRACFKYILHAATSHTAFFEFFLVFSYSKNVKIACYLGVFYRQIALNLLKYVLFINTVHPTIQMYPAKFGERIN